MSDLQRSFAGEPWDEIFGGGVVDGAVTLLTGPPGTGKTVMLLQIVAGLAEDRHRNVLYVLRDQLPSEARRQMERCGLPQGRISIATGFDDGLIARIGTFAAVVIDVARQGESIEKVIAACRAAGVPLFVVKRTDKDGDYDGRTIDIASVDMAIDLDFGEDEVSDGRDFRVLKYRYGKVGDSSLTMTANGLVAAKPKHWYRQLVGWLKWAFQGRKR